MLDVPAQSITVSERSALVPWLHVTSALLMARNETVPFVITTVPKAPGVIDGVAVVYWKMPPLLMTVLGQLGVTLIVFASKTPMLDT